MRWSNFFHIYQPPAWNADIIRQVANESYRPLIDILERHPGLHITLNITGSLIEQLVALNLQDVLDRFRHLVEKGQVEIVGSAMYHPILPLLPATEIRRQITLQEELLHRFFGPVYKPAGFFPPEMAYSDILEPILAEFGFQWVIVDEPSAGGPIGKVNFDQRYRTPNGLGLIFRNRSVSDYLSFIADIKKPEDSLRAITHDDRSQHELVTAMDGENLGHHRHGVEKLWEFLVTWPDMTTATLSQYRDSLRPDTVVIPQPASWSSQVAEVSAGVPFGLWNHPDNPIHQLQWELTNEVIATVEQAVGDDHYEAARRLLDQALASDKFWWASASPWWDITIIIRETQKLADVITPLTNLKPRTRNTVERLMDQVAATAQLWEKTGLAKKRQATYLQASGGVHYMGGNKVTT